MLFGLNMAKLRPQETNYGKSRASGRDKPGWSLPAWHEDDMSPFLLGLSEYSFQTYTSENWRPTLPIFRKLGYAPIGVKFPPSIAPHVLYTVKKKSGILFITFLVIAVLIYLSYFRVKKRFLNSFYDMLWKIFHLFQYCNFTTYHYVRTSEEKNSKKWLWMFFLTVYFHSFFQDFLHIWCYISVSFTNIWKI
jgi:hypothetical protein